MAQHSQNAARDPSPGGASRPGEQTALRRSLGLVHVVLYGLGVTVGAGIYVLIASAAARAGVHAPLAFVLAAIGIGLTGATFAELGSRMPQAAGPVIYAHEAFRSDLVGHLVGLLVIAMTLVSAATISAGAAGYIGVFVPWPRWLVIGLVVLAMGALAGRGIVESISFAGLMTVIEIGGLLVVIGLGLLYEPDVLATAGAMVPRSLEPQVWNGIIAASLLAVFAFIGFEGIVNIVEEMRDPERTLPRAILVTLVLTTLLYIAVLWVALAALGVEQLAASDAPLAMVFHHLAGASPRTMAAIAIVAILNGIIVNIIMASRVMYGMARRGGLPPILGQVHPRLQTPLPATALATVVVLALALLLRLDDLADVSARATLVVFAIVNLALAVIKRRETRPPEGIFIAPAWVPWAGMLGCIAFIAADIAKTGH